MLLKFAKRRPCGLNRRFINCSESYAHPKLDLPLTVVVGGVDVERLAEGGGIGLEAGKKIERRKRAVNTAGRNVVASCFQLGNVLVVEEVEGLGEKLQLAQVTEVELLA